MKECTKLKKRKSHILFKKVQLTSNKQENIKIPFKVVNSKKNYLKTYGFYRAVESKLIVWPSTGESTRKSSMARSCWPMFRKEWEEGQASPSPSLRQAAKMNENEV